MKSVLTPWLRFLIVVVGFFFAAHSVLPADPSKTDKSKQTRQFVYTFRLVPRLHSDAAWTDDDKATLARHFNRFKEAMDRGELILAGRTLESGDKILGIAIFEATDEVAAKKFMEADPAVAAGLMTAELHPFTVVLERKNPQ